MQIFVVTLTESGENTIVGRYADLEAAKDHLRQVRYYPEYRRTEESLDISEDGMSGTGYDESGQFEYRIKPASITRKCFYALEAYRNGCCRRFEWWDGLMLDCATGIIAPKTWEAWELMWPDLKKQGFKPYPDECLQNALKQLNTTQQ